MIQVVRELRLRLLLQTSHEDNLSEEKILRTQYVGQKVLIRYVHSTGGLDVSLSNCEMRQRCRKIAQPTLFHGHS